VPRGVAAASPPTIGIQRADRGREPVRSPWGPWASARAKRLPERDREPYHRDTRDRWRALPRAGSARRGRDEDPQRCAGLTNGVGLAHRGGVWRADRAES